MKFGDFLSQLVTMLVVIAIVAYPLMLTLGTIGFTSISFLESFFILANIRLIKNAILD